MELLSSTVTPPGNGTRVAPDIGTVKTPIIFVHRLFGAAALDVATYEEIEADRKGTPQAVAVVLMSAAAAGIGARGFGDDQHIPLVAIAVISLVAWAAWAAITLHIGGRMFPEPTTKVDIGELLRTLGFASAPGMLRIFGLIPPLAAPMFVLTAIWMLLAMIVAVRQSLDYSSTVRAVAVCTFGFTLALFVAAVLGMLFTTPVA